MESGLFQIGEMAHLFQLSVSSIRHYEQLGLITPEKIDPDTGYRYYSTRQFEVFNTIRYLRALDMPLPQIREFLQGRDITRMEDMLQQQKQAVLEKQQELQRIERRLNSRLRLLHTAQSAKLGEIEFLTLSPCRLYAKPEPLRIRSYYDMELPISRLISTQPDAMVFLGKVGLSLTPEQLLKRCFEEYSGLFLLLENEDRVQGTVLELPSQSGLRLRFRGSHPQAAEQYRRLMDYANAHRLVPAGFSREITLIDYGLTDNPEKFVTEIVIPVSVQ